MTPEGYNDNVFINCPFDEDYEGLFRSIVFTIHACGFVARCAKEDSDAGDVRIDKIYSLIQESKYGIHDLSRAHTSLDTRYNMPLELGIFMGCKRFGNKQQRVKGFIVFDSARHEYQKYISDISGQDISTHNNQPLSVITAIRNWLFAKVAVPQFLEEPIFSISSINSVTTSLSFARR